MANVPLNLPGHGYEVRIEPGLLRRLGESVREVAPHDKAGLVVDEHIADAHGRLARDGLHTAGYEVGLAIQPAGEKHKNLDSVRVLYDRLLEAGLERKSPILAVGGGIISDMAGFAAATYLRGVPFIPCPTTLLAMVDASVGGKVGVNVPQGKNLVGAFHQPRLVVIDPRTLNTLPPRQIRCGLAECIKHGMLGDADLFAWLEEHLDRVLALEAEAMTELIEWNVRIKAAVVMEDEREAGVRAHLNLGHTFAHAIETTTRDAPRGGYEHGEAVSLGMVAATRLAVESGRCEAELLPRLVSLLERVGLPTGEADLPPTEALLEAMQLDKKVADGRIRLILPDRLGRVSMVGNAPAASIAAAWDALRR